MSFTLLPLTYPLPPRLSELHEEVRLGYDRLHVSSINGPEGRHFTEPKVAALWQLARRSDFSEQELRSLWVRRQLL